MTTERSRSVMSGSVMAELFRNPGFLACVALLAVLAVAYQVLAGSLQKRKLEVPIKRALDQLDRSALYPYELLHPYPPIKGEMLDALGTKQYVQWLLQDTTLPAGAPEKYIHLFVTYYTGNPDQVPHVPEICYSAQGNKVVEDRYDEVPIPALGRDYSVPIKVLEFEGSRLLGRQNTIVLYTFQSNGQFCRDRRDVQSAVGSPLTRYAYFSKLELSFGSQEQVPDKAKSIAAGKKFLQVVIPVLLRDHWPDWDPAARAPVGAAAPGGSSKTGTKPQG